MKKGIITILALAIIIVFCCFVIEHYFKSDEQKITMHAIDYASSDFNGNDKFIYAYIDSDLNLDKNALTEEQKKNIQETKMLANEYAPTMRLTVDYLIKNKVEEMISITNPSIIKNLGLDRVRVDYQEFANYFNDFKSMDEYDGLVSKYGNNNDSVAGMAFQENFSTTSGENKVFIIIITPHNSQYYIEYVFPKITIKDIDSQ